MDSENTYSYGRGGWLIHDSNDVQASNRAGILRSLSLVVVEVCGNGDNGVDNLAVFQHRHAAIGAGNIYLLPKVAFSDISHLAQNHGRYFFGGERPVFSLNLNGYGGLVI